MKYRISVGLLCLLPLALCAQESPDKVMATVNGAPITNLEVKHFITRQSKPTAEPEAIQEMINVELLVQTAKKEGFLEKPFLKLEIERSKDALIASLYLQQVLRDMDVSEEKLKKRYNKEFLSGKMSATEYNANHILVKTEQEAREVITRLDKGESFEELAKTLSTGPSGKNGGELGWFKPESMVPPFSEAAKQLKPGNYSKQPVETQFGWHVILLNELRQTPPPSFEAMKTELRTLIAAEGIREKVSELRSSAKIEITTE